MMKEDYNFYNKRLKDINQKLEIIYKILIYLIRGYIN